MTCDGGTSRLRAVLGRGYPPYPGQAPRQDWGGTPNRKNIACTCYAASGMPIAFTQEDFLVKVDGFIWI